MLIYTTTMEVMIKFNRKDKIQRKIKNYKKKKIKDYPYQNRENKPNKGGIEKLIYQLTK